MGRRVLAAIPTMLVIITVVFFMMRAAPGNPYSAERMLTPAVEANLIPIPKVVSDAAMDAAECIGCGACVAACPNGAASLFTAAKMQHLNLLPQGQSERWQRSQAMVETMA